MLLTTFSKELLGVSDRIYQVTAQQQPRGSTVAPVSLADAERLLRGG